MGDGFRELRDRQAARDAALDRLGESPVHGAARRALSIYDGGSMGTGGGIYYLGNPVVFNGVEQEGGSYTPVIDTYTSVAVDVLGSTPSVGDILIAAAVAGRWVAERGMAATGCDCPVCASCDVGGSSCLFYAGDLGIAWTNTGVIGDGSATLYFQSEVPPSTCYWSTGCLTLGSGLYYAMKLYCDTSGNTQLQVFEYTDHNCTNFQLGCTSASGGTSTWLNYSTQSCSPLNLVYTCSSANCFLLGIRLWTSFTVTGPQPLSGPTMCGAFCVSSCGPIAGATVSVYTSMGGMPVATGATPADGCLNLSWQGSPGSYYITIAATGYQAYTATATLACNATYTVVMQAYAGITSVECCYDCPYPIASKSASGTYITDANGTYEMSYYAPGDAMILGYNATVLTLYCIVPVSSVQVASPPGITCTGSTGTTYIVYIGYCTGPSSGAYTYTVYRYWSSIFCDPAAQDYYYASGFVPGALNNYSSATLSVPDGITCLPFTWSSALAQSGGVSIADPVGGTVVVAG